MSEPAHLLHVFATFCPAGPQVRTVALMHGFGDRFRHTVIACDGRTEARSLVKGVQLDTLEFNPGGGAMAPVKFFRGVLKSVNPDLLLTYNWGAMDAVIAARTAGFHRHVHHEDGFNIDEADGLKARRNWARRISLRSRDLIVPSEKLRTIARKTWRLPRVHLIVNGVDASATARSASEAAAFREQYGVPTDAFVIGTVGHLRPVKRYDRLIRAVAGAPFPDDVRPHVVIVGDGPERAKLDAVAQECSDRVAVTFTGHVESLQPAYSAFDLFSLSSDSEQLPVSLLEAMSAEVPVAATDVGDIAGTLPPEARPFVVPLSAATEDHLGKAMAELAGDPEKRARLAGLGLERVRAEYSVEAMVEAYGAVYGTALRR